MEGKGTKKTNLQPDLRNIAYACGFLLQDPEMADRAREGIDLFTRGYPSYRKKFVRAVVSKIPEDIQHELLGSLPIALLGSLNFTLTMGELGLDRSKTVFEIMESEWAETLLGLTPLGNYYYKEARQALKQKVVTGIVSVSRKAVTGEMRFEEVELKNAIMSLNPLDRISFFEVLIQIGARFEKENKGVKKEDKIRYYRNALLLLLAEVYDPITSGNKYIGNSPSSKSLSDRSLALSLAMQRSAPLREVVQQTLTGLANGEEHPKLYNDGIIQNWESRDNILPGLDVLFDMGVVAVMESDQEPSKGKPQKKGLSEIILNNPRMLARVAEHYFDRFLNFPPENTTKLVGILCNKLSAEELEKRYPFTAVKTDIEKLKFSKINEALQVMFKGTDLNSFGGWQQVKNALE